MPSQNPLPADYVSRLCRSARNARLSTRKLRDGVLAAVREYVGHHYSEEGAADKVPVNLLAVYVSVITRNLIAANPRVMYSTFDLPNKPTVSAMQKWANQEVQRLHFADVESAVVMDALFGLGIAKVALADPAEAANSGWGLKAGEPFFSQVLQDDFVYDVHAKNFGECSFVGHRYRVPLDVVKDSKFYSKARKELQPSPNSIFNETGDQRLDSLVRSTYGAGDDEFEPMVDLWEFYLPRHRMMVTVADQQFMGAEPVGANSEALRAWDWVGPDSGPYHFLSLGGPVPGNALGKAPVMDLIDLHEATNLIYRKVIRTAERCKEVGMAAGNDEDAKRINEASDGETVRVDQPDRFKQEVISGNHVQLLTGIVTVLKDLFSFVGGNLELLGGRGPQAKTASQDQLLNANASAGVADMQQKTVDHAASVLRALGWYWWNHPEKVMTSQHALPGLPGLAITRHVTPAMRRQGRWEDLELRVDPYSLRYQSPQQRLQSLMQIMQTIVMPIMPILQTQGISVDLNTLLRKVGEYTDQPDLPEILTIQAPAQGGDSGGEPPRMPQQTERSYTRTNVPGRTEKGNDQQVAAAMLGVDLGGDPDKEQAA